ncbi:MAG TPA: hypothetical protein VIV88_13700 [Gemmatimonadales bacterium]
MHIELTEMLRCPESHGEAFLVMSTGEMLGRMVRSGILGCPICRREFPIVKGIVDFSGKGKGERGKVDDQGATIPLSPFPFPAVDPETLQALLDLSGPGGYVVLLGTAARHAVGLAGLMGGIHFVGINAPSDVEELPVLSLLVCPGMIPLRQTIARGVVVGSDRLGSDWLAEARRVVLPGRRVVIEGEDVPVPVGLTRLAVGEGLFVGERR